LALGNDALALDVPLIVWQGSESNPAFPIDVHTMYEPAEISELE
jgi:hypothetical protein